MRLRFGRFELILEGVRGGHSLLWGDGKEARRFALGLGNFDELQLAFEPPPHAVRLGFRESLVLAPGGRLRGYVQVPLVPTLFGGRTGEAAVRLVEFTTGELAPEWDEASGLLLRATGSWLVRFPMPTGEPRAVVPLRLHNDTEAVAAPGECDVWLRAADLVELRGALVTAPRRLAWNGHGLVDATGASA